MSGPAIVAGRRARLARGIATLAATLGALAGDERGAAAETSSSLAWERGAGAESCITAEELVAAVEGQLGQRLASPDRATTRIEGQISREGDGGPWQVAFELLGRDGTRGRRTLVSQAPSCRELDTTLTLVIALMVDPTAALGMDLDAPRPAPPPPRPLPPPRPAAEHFRKPLRVAAAMSPVVGVGRSEGASVGYRAAASIQPPRFWPIELGLTAWARDRIHVGSASADVSMLDVGLGLAPWLWRRGRWEISTGLGLALGVTSAQGLDLSEARRATAATLTLWARGRVELTITRHVRAFLGLCLEVPAIRPRIVYRDAEGTQHLIGQPATAAGVAELGVIAIFGT